MAINFGSDNTSRYYTVPDHDDFTLPTSAWTWISVVTPNYSNTDAKYMISTGGFEAANSFNLMISSGSHNLGCAINEGALQNTGASVQTGIPHIVYACRTAGGEIRHGFVRLDNQSHTKSLPYSKNQISNGSGLIFGGRIDLDAARFYRGAMSWAALLNVALTDTDIENLGTGASVFMTDHGSNVVELWDFSTASATVTGLIGGHVATRMGSGWGADLPDPLPYQGQAAISFNGPVPTLNGSVNSAFSQSVAGYFSGSEKPFTFSLQSGTLPGGLTLNTSTGVISGTPSTQQTASGIVIRGTDTNSDTADTNAFSIVISEEVEVTKGIRITLHDRSLTPRTTTTGIVARWWDAPGDTGSPDYQSSSASINSSGVLELNLNGSTALAVGNLGYLTLYKQGATPQDDWHFAARVAIEDIA